MQVCHIVPILNTDSIIGKPMNMFLTHLIEESDHYCGLARSSNSYKIVDNSLWELKIPINITRVVEAANKICAHEIILPDYLNDFTGTMKAVDKALSELPSKHSFNLMAVVQGRNIIERIECFRELMSIKEIDIVGIPKIIERDSSRIDFLNRAKEFATKPLHFLGIWKSINECYLHDSLNYLVRSADSSLGAVQVKYGLSFAESREQSQAIDFNEHLDSVILNSHLEVFDNAIKRISTDSKRTDARCTPTY